MSFFSLFPQYLTTLPDGNQIIITDFFRRIAVSDRYQAAITTLMPYSIEEGERPEIVSNKIYGSPDYHWVILLINNMVSVYTEWPISYRELVNKIYYTYDYTLGVSDTTEFAVGDILSYYDRYLYVTSIGIGTITAISEGGQILINAGTTLKNITKNVDGIILQSIVDPQFAIHHYIDQNTGYQIDYDVGNPYCIPVSNIEYEIAKNDEKRDILILDPAYLQDFVTLFEQKIGT